MLGLLLSKMLYAQYLIYYEKTTKFDDDTSINSSRSTTKERRSIFNMKDYKDIPLELRKMKSTTIDVIQSSDTITDLIGSIALDDILQQPHTLDYFMGFLAREYAMEV